MKMKAMHFGFPEALEKKSENIKKYYYLTD